MSITLCHECGAVMVQGVRPMPLAYRGLTLTVEMPGWYCPCGESTHTGKDMVVSDRGLNLLKARAEGLLEPARIRAIRVKLGISQRLASQILGGGPNAFHKYEQGDVLPSRAISNLLRLLEADPSLLALLKEEGTPPPPTDHTLAALV